MCYKQSSLTWLWFIYLQIFFFSIGWCESRCWEDASDSLWAGDKQKSYCLDLQRDCLPKLLFPALEICTENTAHLKKSFRFNIGQKKKDSALPFRKPPAWWHWSWSSTPQGRWEEVIYLGEFIRKQDKKFICPQLLELIKEEKYIIYFQCWRCTVLNCMLGLCTQRHEVLYGVAVMDGWVWGPQTEPSPGAHS